LLVTRRRAPEHRKIFVQIAEKTLFDIKTKIRTKDIKIVTLHACMKKGAKPTKGLWEKTKDRLRTDSSHCMA